jgi:methylglutaconyl-CoA hydratase
MTFYTQEAVKNFDTIHLSCLQTTLNGHIFTITLNRPEKRNAFTPTMATEIAFSVAYAHYHPEVRCIILKANGPVFCAGADLMAFHDPATDQKNPALPQPSKEVLLGDVFRELHKPCIAQVEGPVLAGGFLLICGATFVISTVDATFGLPEVKRGIWPMQVMASLSRVVSPRKFLELSITGQNYSAAEALAMGLVTCVTDRNRIESEVDNLAAQITENAPYAIKLGMESFEKLSDLPQSEQHHFLQEQLKILLATEDAREGSDAFKEKRKPVWKGK